MAEIVSAAVSEATSSSSSTSTSTSQATVQPQRRPRVREVSSRFMTPVASRSSSSSSVSPGPCQKSRSNSVQRQRCSGASPFGDENRNDSNRGSPQRKPNRAMTKLTFAAGGFPGTPIPEINSTRNVQQLETPMATREAGLGLIADSNASVRTPAIVVSSRYMTERGSRKVMNSNSAVAASPCSRSLELQCPSGDGNSMFSSLKASEKEHRDWKSNAVKLSCHGLPLPPPINRAKPSSSDASAKPRKAQGNQEEMHSLKLLYNRYLQWRFVNAKAEAFFPPQQKDAERQLHSQFRKIAELYESVTRKRIELARLQKHRTLLCILETQNPYLNEWSTFEGEFGTSLSETIQGLLNASVRVPLGGNAVADVLEVQEALNSASKFLESITIRIINFMFNADHNEALMSDLAKLVGGERALIDQCGELLSVAFKSQIEEHSLRSHLIQVLC